MIWTLTLCASLDALLSLSSDGLLSDEGAGLSLTATIR